ncbi:hypothetical protein L0222_06430 [bacterium]|nr:hypothetical protein [bacterium]MCI0605985.1 hypothetical protein [bacterium]
MATLKIRYLASAIIILLFAGSSLYFSRKGAEGPWHAKVMELWEKEEWHNLRALGENLHETGKQDVESYYLAMLASEQLQDAAGVQVFAARLSESRALNWSLEQRIAKLHKPDSLRKRIALFRTKIVFAALAALFLFLIFSLRRREPYQVVPALISVAGLVALML